MDEKPLSTLEVTSIIAYVFLTALGIFITYHINELVLRILVMPIVSALIIMDLSYRYHYKKIYKNTMIVLNILLVTFMIMLNINISESR